MSKKDKKIKKSEIKSALLAEGGTPDDATAQKDLMLKQLGDKFRNADE